ncbi:MAG: nuclear transport factor 2 family protein, partial [Rhizobiaceae bacterium]
MTSNVDVHDWIAIQELKARYCRYLDTKQWDAWKDLFTEDYALDVSQESGLAPIVGRDSAVAMVRSIIETTKTAHQVHSP